MADIGEKIKEVEFEPFPQAAPIEEPVPEPIVVPEKEPEKVPA
jgi:hypothetical protein